MEENHKLECDYCGVPITEKDYKCPNCGADCSKTVKKYKEEKEKKEKEKLEKEEKIREEITNRTMESFKTTSRIVKIIFAIAFISIIGVMILMVVGGIRASQSHNESGSGSSGFTTTKDEPKKVSVGYNELAEGSDYSIILDGYEFYAYDSEYFSDVYRTKDGYQKIAFHFIAEGLSSYETSFYPHDITLKADDYVVETASLEKGIHEYVVVGNESYPKFQGSVTEGEKLQGYVGFLVPKDKKELKFKVGKITITMDNPAYAE